jgi:hypothetical protein
MTPADRTYLAARKLAHEQIAAIERENLEALNRRFHAVYGFDPALGNGSFLRNVLELREIHAQHRALLQLGDAAELVISGLEGMGR